MLYSTLEKKRMVNLGIFLCKFRTNFGGFMKKFFVIVFALVFSLGSAISSTAPTPNKRVGSVSAIGKVQLRGVSLSTDGAMMFCGDRVRTFAKSYAKVLFVDGGSVELAPETEVRVLGLRDCEAERSLDLSFGRIGFSAKKAMVVSFGGYRFEVSSKSAGNMAVFASELGLRVVKGNITFRGPGDKKGVKISKGQERVLDLKNGQLLAPTYWSTRPVQE
ncbi:MAG: FecR domain-containing protein [Candidatus Zambryskibacteria bacterium]|nr:FecR domain-containing protein [Candidatus Zambryskibacteria bacterium]